MKLTLANVKFAAFASKETNCFQATLLADGKKVCYVSNSGRGGCDHHALIDHQLFAEVTAWVEQQTYFCPYGKETVNHSLDTYVGQLFERHQSEKMLQKKLKAGWLFTITGKRGIYAIKDPAHQMDIRAAKEKHRMEQILNTMPPDAALTLFMEQSA